MPKNQNSSKVRFDSLDVAAMVGHIQRCLLGRRVINIYDGVSDQDSFLIKLDSTGNSTKEVLFLESGIRFHPTTQQSSLQQEGMPSPFCSKLRKHLRGLRLERVSQLGNYDRVVLFQFGTGSQRHCLILELYARGNIILTNAEFNVLALLRSHEYENQVAVQVGHVYPVTYATSLERTDKDGDEEQEQCNTGLLKVTTGKEALAWARQELQARNDSSRESSSNKNKKNPSALPLKALLLRPSSGVYHFGPSLIEHCVLCADLNPDAKLTVDSVEEQFKIAEWERLITVLQNEGPRIMTDLSTLEGKGYILYQPGGEDKASEPKTSLGLQHTDKILQEFQPHLLKQHKDRMVLTYDNFAQAVDDFFAHIGGQKSAQRAESAEKAAKEKLEKIRRDQEQRIEALMKEQELMKEHAQLVEAHSEDVDKALNVIDSALVSGMDWEALEQLVETEQANQNPIACLIKRLDLANDSMVLALPDVFADGQPTVSIRVSLHESAHANASNMYAKYRASKEKSQKTIEASTKALKAAEATAQKQLAEAQKKRKLTTSIHQKRKPHWFEKFHWMITSDNYLVLGGKDAQQNEMLVKRYLRPGDAYLHADVHGAASCVLRAKRRRRSDGKTKPLPLPEQALREAGNFTICRSSAWASRMVTSAWWVESHQVSKTAPSGEYLTVGSFMVRGKKNFLPPSQLEMGLAIMFRLGDDESIARHLNDRRDFGLLAAEEDDFEEADPLLSDPTDLHDDVEGDEEVFASKDMNREEASSEGETEENENGDKQEGGEGDQLAQGHEGEPGHDPGANGSVRDSPISDQKETIDSGSPAEPKLKKGFSKRDRKLINKYGSIEAAEAAKEREHLEQSVQKKTEQSREEEKKGQATLQNAKRGKRSKLKRAAKKYVDQDEEERELALLALHAGERKSKKKNGRSKEIKFSAREKQAAEDTAALLLKDPKKAADALPKAVESLLAECVTQQSPEQDKAVVSWQKFDADVLEQLSELSEEQQLAAAKRLLTLKQSTRVDNFSASLSGVIRTIRRYGHENLESEASSDLSKISNDATRRKTKSEKLKEEEAWRETLAEEGIVDDDLDGDAVDDTTETNKLTGKPSLEDSILYALPVCAPYQTLSQYKYRVKLTPGSQKRGKAARQCVEMFLAGDGRKSIEAERYRELIKQISDNEFVQVMCSDVKISAAGASKAAKQIKSKSNGKKGAKKR